MPNISQPAPTAKLRNLYKKGGWWLKRIRVYEEFYCPKCDHKHTVERETPQEYVKTVECPKCGFKKST